MTFNIRLYQLPGYISQASNMKETLEELVLKREEATIASVLAINTYPSIKHATIRKAVSYLQENLPKRPRRPSTFASNSPTSV